MGKTGMRKLARRMGTALTIAVWVSLQAASAHALARQYKIEAAFLYHFFNYITWPGEEETEQPHESVICVFPDDPIIPYLAYVQQKSKDSNPIAVREVREGQVDGCHLLYVQEQVEKAVKDKAWNEGILLVSSEQEPEPDMMINLLRKDERIAIHIHHQAMRDAGFKISSRLLALAEVAE